MTSFPKAFRKLGYRSSPWWDAETDRIARWAATTLGKERVCWIASADNLFRFEDSDDDCDTGRIFRLTKDPVIWAAYGWHVTGPHERSHISTCKPNREDAEMYAAHLWYLLRTSGMTFEEEENPES